MIDSETSYIVLLSIGSVTMTVLVFLIIVFLANKLYKTLLYELILYLFIACFFNTLSIVIYHFNEDSDYLLDESICKLQAFLMITFEFSQHLWASIIAHSIYQNVVRFDKETIDDETFYYRVIYIMLGFFLPLTLTVLAYFLDDLGPSTNYCWFSTAHDMDRVKVPSVLYYFILWLLIVYNFIVTYRIIRFIYSEFNFNDNERMIVRSYIKGLLKYPLVPLVVLVPATVKRLIELFFGIDNVYIHYIFILIVSMQGMIYSITYGYNPEIISILKQNCRRLCCGKKAEVHEIKNAEYTSFEGDGVHSFINSFQHNNDTLRAINTTNERKTKLSPTNTMDSDWDSNRRMILRKRQGNMGEFERYIDFPGNN